MNRASQFNGADIPPRLNKKSKTFNWAGTSSSDILMVLPNKESYFKLNIQGRAESKNTRPWWG